MKLLTRAVLKAGLISPAQLQEMKRISPVIDPEAEVQDPVPLDLAVKYIRDALESEEYVLIRETDLEVLRQYTQSVQKGTLRIDGIDIDVSFGKTKLGEFIIPWISASISEYMTQPTTWLMVEGADKTYFRDVRELFFGEQKAFMVCMPAYPVPDEHG
jgi:hypothetical protein